MSVGFRLEGVPDTNVPEVSGDYRVFDTVAALSSAHPAADNIGRLGFVDAGPLGSSSLGAVQVFRATNPVDFGSSGPAVWLETSLTTRFLSDFSSRQSAVEDWMVDDSSMSPTSFAGDGIPESSYAVAHTFSGGTYKDIALESVGDQGSVPIRWALTGDEDTSLGSDWGAEQIGTAFDQVSANGTLTLTKSVPAGGNEFAGLGVQNVTGAVTRAYFQAEIQATADYAGSDEVWLCLIQLSTSKFVGVRLDGSGQPEIVGGTTAETFNLTSEYTQVDYTTSPELLRVSVWDGLVRVWYGDSSQSKHGDSIAIVDTLVDDMTPTFMDTASGLGFGVSVDSGSVSAAEIQIRNAFGCIGGA